METAIGKLETAYKAWESQNQKLYSLFQGREKIVNSKAVNQEKLLQLNIILSLHRKSNDGYEKLLLRALLVEKKHLQEGINPKWYKRIIPSIIDSLTTRFAVRKIRTKESNHLADVKASLEKIELPFLYEAVKQKIENKETQFTEKYVHQVNEHERVSYELNFSQTGDKTNLASFRTVLIDKNNPKDIRQNTFRVNEGQYITAIQAHSLLKGEVVQTGNDITGTWSKLDFTDKDAQGHFHLQTYRKDVFSGLDEVIDKCSLTSPLNFQEMISLKRALRNGESYTIPIQKTANNEVIKIKIDSSDAEVIAENTHNNQGTEGPRSTLRIAFRKHKIIEKKTKRKKHSIPT